MAAPIHIGFCQVNTEGDWRSANTESIKNAAQDAGYRLTFLVGKNKNKNQISEVRSLIAQKVDILAIAPSQKTGWDQILSEAKEANIPVIIMDRIIDVADNSLWVTHLGSNLREQGRIAGRWAIKEFLEHFGKVNIVELRGTQGSTPAIDRNLGFREIIAQDPRFRIIFSEPADFTQTKGKEVMAKVLNNSNKSVQLVYAHNDDMALGAIEVIRQKGLEPGHDIKIISIDAVKKALVAIIKGDLNCSIECSPLLGPLLMQTVKKILNGETVPRHIYMQDKIFTRENAEELLLTRTY